jgi:hypothetical protein
LNLKRLEELQSNKTALAKKFEFANFSVGLKMWNAESNIRVVSRKMIEVQQHMEAMEDEIQMMKDGGGTVLWPKP